ncbi:MAG: hypothetical protein AAF351_00040 [Pseudomonadota bacterium]
MNTDHDPQLESLFAEASANDTVDDDFTDRVMQRVNRRRQNVWTIRIAIVAAIVALEMLLAAPLQTTVGTFMHWLSTPLVSMEESWAATLLEPVNSIAGVVGVLLLLGHVLYRKILH